MLKYILSLWLMFFLSFAFAQQNEKPNVLLVIADDLGVDMFNGYGFSGLKPTTPVLDSLRSVGLTFDNVWSSPSCTPTRAAIMSGKYGVKTGVLKAPGNLDTVHTSLFRALPQEYSSALVGKWHISLPVDNDHPTQHGVSYYSGAMQAGVTDYYNWDRTEAGMTVNDTNYVTEVFTDKALGWIQGRSEPWFMWLAHVAPHSPVHLPPSYMYSLRNNATNFRKYVTMIESLDYDLGRLIDSLPDSVIANTTIIIVGDNGTPGNYTQDYPADHGKGTLYQGAVHVPMIIAGKGVGRINDREDALVHVCDIYSTILELAGEELEGGIYNSLSFAHLLNDSSKANKPTRDYNYSEIESTNSGWTIRNEQYKLNTYDAGGQEFYDLVADSLEFINLIDSLTATQLSVKQDLEAEANSIRTSWSCRDHIRNGDEEGIDCGGSSCDACQTVAVEELQEFQGKVYPNPVKDILNLDFPDVQYPIDLQVFNTNGKAMMQITATSPQVDLSDLPSGVYILHLDGMQLRFVKGE